MLVSTFATLREVAFDLRAANDNTPAGHPSAELARAVYATLGYFDMFDFPLTGWEVYKYLWRAGMEREVGFLEVQGLLEGGAYGITAHGGFYVLPGRGGLVSLRKHRQTIAADKYRRARRIARVLSMMPFTRLIAVSNSLAYDNVRADSDIDLFVVVAAEHIWTARFFTAGLLKFFRLRPTPARKRDTVCLNFFVSEDALAIGHLRKHGQAPDVYFAYWLRQLVPLYDAGGVFNLLQEQNRWAVDSVGYGGYCRPNRRRRIVHGATQKFFNSTLEKLCGFRGMENFLKRIQLSRLPQTITAKMNKSSDVVVNDCVLKFHDKDRRAEFRDGWLAKLK